MAEVEFEETVHRSPEGPSRKRRALTQSVSAGNCTHPGLDLSNMDMSCALLTKLQAPALIARGGNWSGARLLQAALPHALLDDSLFEGADLREVDFAYSHATRACFRNARMDDAWCPWVRWNEVILERVRARSVYFAAADLRDSDFSQGDFKDSVFTGSQLQNANFTKANLRGCNLSECDLSGADFSGADLSGATLAESKIDKAKLKRAINVPSDAG